MELIILPFMQRAFIAGILAAATSGLLGIFVVLRRSSFFGDAIAHASLTGVAAGLVLGIDPLFSAIVIAIAISLFLFKSEKEKNITTDTLLGFVLPFFMALGVVILSFTSGYQPELISFLFGSILSVGWNSLLVIGMLSTVVFLFICVLKNDLILTTFDQCQAKLSGISVEKTTLFYYLILSLTIVISIKTVGVILANALLVIPAATAKLIASSLSQMFILTPLIGIAGTILGLIISYYLNLPSGPAIVVIMGIVFLTVFSLKSLI